MRASKWHALSNVVNTIRRVGSIEYGDAGISESSYNLFKKQYRHTSRERRAAVSETLVQLSTKTISASMVRKTYSVETGNKCVIKCVAQNKTVCVAGYKAATILQCQEKKQYLLETKLDTYWSHVASDHILI